MLDLADTRLLDRVAEVVASLGTHKQAAEKTGIAYATLQRMLKGRAPVTHERLNKIAVAAGTTGDDIRRDDDVASPSSPVPNIIAVPALKVKAAAGDGSLANDDRVAPGPFHMTEDWLRKKFGSLTGLRLVQVKGDSQVPELHEGDWVLIDQNRNTVENGLAVLLLDDCLMIKFLQRDGYTLHLISRNPHYRPTILDLRQDEDRLRVIGKAVYCFKAV